MSEPRRAAFCAVTVIEDHGDSLMVEFQHSRGNTRMFVDRCQVEFKSVPPARSGESAAAVIQ
jgi:hypothetical protein